MRCFGRYFLIPLLTVLFLVICFRNNSSTSSQIVYAEDTSNENQIENFNRDLNQADDHWIHTNRGWEYAKNGDYEKSIEEYKKAIEVIQNSPGDEWPNLKKEDADRINQEAKNDSQIFPRHRLVK